MPCDRVTNGKNMEYYLNRNCVYTAKGKYVNFFRMVTITAFSNCVGKCSCEWLRYNIYIVYIVYLPYIQGVSRLVDITAGGDFLGLCDHKSSHKHVSDFGRLRSYGHFLILVHALV